MPPPTPKGTYQFRHFGVDQGLTNLAVLSIAQDAAGYLWVGTEDGLFRYDGRQFVKFGSEAGLPSSFVRLVKTTSDGWVWVDTEQGLARGRNGKFHPVETKFRHSIDSLRQALAVDQTGGVWAGDDAGLWFTRGGAPFQLVKDFPGGTVEAVWVDAEGKQVLAARRGSVFYRDAAGKWSHIQLPAKHRKEYPHGLLVDRLGRIWVRSLGWLLRYASPTAAPEDLTGSLRSGPSQWADLLPQGTDRVWAPTNQGLACIEPDGTWVLGESRGLASAAVNTAFVDREGSLWIGSEGLHRLAGRMAWSATGQQHGLPHDTVWNLRRSGNGTLAACTQEGVAIAKGDAWTSVAGTKHRTFYALTEDPEGRIVAGGSRGLTQPTNSVFVQVKDAQFRELPLEGLRNSVATMAWAPDGQLWVGTVGQGLHRYRLEGGRFRGGPVELPGGDDRETFHQVILDANGHPAASGFKGVALWNGHAWHRLGKAHGLLDDHTAALALAPDGSIYLTYWDVHGLTRLQRSGDRWGVAQHLTEPRELLGDAIHSIGIGLDGTLWMGTAVGIRRWDGRRLVRYTHHNGLPGDDTSGNALWVEPSGDVWCGLTAGAVHFDATRDPGPPTVPKVRLEGFHNGANQDLAPGAEASLPYALRTVSFSFTPDSFLHESGLRPQVRLVGFEDEWRESEVFQTRYTGLPKGHYRFEVRFLTRDGLIGPVTSQPFRILSPWWQQWWAYLLGLAGFAGLIALTVRWRTRLILRRMVQLETLVHERTWDLEQANDALSHLNKALEEASMVDPLTGLKNRRFLGLSLPEEVARVRRGLHEGGAQESGIELAFLLVDLDHFKAVNDTYGHAAGDAVLRQAASVLRCACRESDTVVRWGGEEFLIVAKATSREHIEIIARHILEGFRAHDFVLEDGRALKKTCSIGFSAFPLVRNAQETFRWEDAVEMADQCLYAAKKTSRDAYVGVWAPPGTEAQLTREAMLHQLPDLAQAGTLALRTSLPESTSLVWA